MRKAASRATYRAAIVAMKSVVAVKPTNCIGFLFMDAEVIIITDRLCRLHFHTIHDLVHLVKAVVAAVVTAIVGLVVVLCY